MSGDRASAAVRCDVCRGPRPGGGLAFGLDALLAGRLVAWLCDECAAVGDTGAAFVAATRQLHPAAEIVRTDSYGDVIVRAPLGDPAAAEGGATP